jgi:hypothetical protein
MHAKWLNESDLTDIHQMEKSSSPAISVSLKESTNIPCISFSSPLTEMYLTIINNITDGDSYMFEGN